jgi:hypothetical protein
LVNLAVNASWSLTGRAGMELFDDHRPRYQAAIGYRPFHRSRRDMVIEVGLLRLGSDWWTMSADMTGVTIDVCMTAMPWLQ